MVGCLFWLLTFIACAMHLDATTEDRVSQMNAVLQNPGWRDLQPLEIIENGQSYNVEQFLAPVDADGQQLIVNDQNVDDKIRQAYHFLSCDYAMMFMTYYHYATGLGYLCSHMPGKRFSEKWECLTQCKRLLEREHLVMRMQSSALSYLYRLSPQIEFKNDVFLILESFYFPYGNEGHPSGLDIRDIVKDETNEINDYLGHVKSKMYTYLTNSCGPSSYMEDAGVGGSILGWAISLVDDIKHNFSQGNAFCKTNDTYTRINTIINDFLITDYTRLGFTFHAESNTTLLSPNPDLTQQADRTDRLLKNSGWHDLDYLKILVHYGMGGLLKNDVDGRTVNEQNLDVRVQRVYQFMNCHYVKILMRLFVYIEAIGKQCSVMEMSNEKFECLKQFVINIKKIDPVIVRMQAALSYFHLSYPQIVFNTKVSKILGFVNNYIQMETITINILNGLSTVQREINTYFQMSCFVSKSLTSLVADDVKKLSKNGIENQLDREVNTFTEINYPSLGFIYNQVSGTTVITE